MTTQDKKELLELIKAREEAAADLKAKYDDMDFDGSTQKLEIRIDKISGHIRNLVFPPIVGKFAEYDNR